MRILTWKEVLERKDEFVGGMIEHEESGSVLVGEILAIKEKGDQFWVESPSLYSLQDGKLVKVEDETMSWVLMSRVQPLEEGARISYHVQLHGTTTLYPRSDEQLLLFPTVEVDTSTASL
jgi:hypothetical protein